MIYMKYRKALILFCLQRIDKILILSCTAGLVRKTVGINKLHVHRLYALSLPAALNKNHRSQLKRQQTKKSELFSRLNRT